MSVYIDTSTIINQDAAAIAERNSVVSPAPHKAASKSEQVEPTKDLSVEAEILTTADLEILKLHALRRAKEYLEDRIKRCSEVFSGSDGAKTTIPAVAEYNALYGERESPPSLEDKSDAENAPGSGHGDKFYKTTSAISNYRVYKKDTPKAWVEGDIDERR